MKQFWVYLMSNKSRRLYTGMTSDIISRVNEHKLKLYPNSFTARYCYDVLVWYEKHPNFSTARARELEIKGWRKAKKVALILPENPDWADLSLEWQEDSGWKLEPDARPRLKVAALRAAGQIPRPRSESAVEQRSMDARPRDGGSTGKVRS